MRDAASLALEEAEARAAKVGRLVAHLKQLEAAVPLTTTAEEKMEQTAALMESGVSGDRLTNARDAANRLKLIAVEAQFKLAESERMQEQATLNEAKAAQRKRDEREAAAEAEKAKAAAKERRVAEEAEKKKAERE